MTGEHGSQNLPEYPNPQEKPVSRDDITPSQEQQPLHFDSPSTRIIKSGSKCSLRCLGGIL